MNILRTTSVAFIATVVAACSAAPSKPAPVAAPAIPATADISGKWLFTVQSPMGTVDANMVIVQTGKDFKGTIDSSMGSVDLTGSVNGKDIKFSYGMEKFGMPAGTNFDYTGLVEGSTMKGKGTFASFGEGEWSAKRQ